jgi:hypothetical protein
MTEWTSLREQLHREFNGSLIRQMPLLVSGRNENGEQLDIPRDPASFAYVLERRMEAPQDVRPTWQKNYVFTGDGSVAGTEGDHLIVLDAQALRELTPESELFNGALVLSADAWQELKAQTEKVTYFTADEVQEAENKGYVKNNGVWTPANKTVGKVWDTLSRGLQSRLSEYVQLVSEASSGSDSLMNVYFNKTTKNGIPTMWSWVAGRINRKSCAHGYNFLDYDDARLLGIAPELAARQVPNGVTGAHVAREKVLEEIVESGS